MQSRVGNLEMPYHLGSNDLWIRSDFFFFLRIFDTSKGPCLGRCLFSRISSFLNLKKLKTSGKCRAGQTRATYKGRECLERFSTCVGRGRGENACVGWRER